MTRAGFVAIIGAPNAGKSTLTNRLVGDKVSIVTQKVQTTRFPVRGVALAGEAQIVLVDTPGIFQPRRRLDRAMVRAAWGGAEEADVIVHLVDAAAEIAAGEPGAKGADRKAAEDVASIVEGLKASGKTAILALNKIDGVKREKLLDLSKTLFETGVYSDVFMISAKTGSGVDDLKAALGARVPENPWFYPEDQTADLPARLMAAEITREKLYLRLHEELPYAAMVETTKFEERQDGSIRIEQTIFVQRESQRPIVLGAGGQTLKWIGQKSREELTELFGHTVHLFLHVAVDETWADKKEFYGHLGLDYDV